MPTGVIFLSNSLRPARCMTKCLAFTFVRFTMPCDPVSPVVSTNP
jgi:hypothetical protein